jgi:hypothetical protein
VAFLVDDKMMNNSQNKRITHDKTNRSTCNLIPLDRGGVPDLLVSGDNFDLVVVDPHYPTTTSET